MNLKLSRPLGIAVISAALCLQPMVAQAGIISTQEVAGKNQADADRAKVQAFLERADVKQRLLALGVKSVFAEQRVASLSDEEIHALAGKIDSVPAGGNLSNNDLIVILLIAILVTLIIAL